MLFYHILDNLIMYRAIISQCDVFVFLTQILPNGVAWIPNLVKTITEVVSNGSKSILVDKKLIDGPNPNEKGKWLIPLIAAFQVRLRNFSVVLHTVYILNYLLTVFFLFIMDSTSS